MLDTTFIHPVVRLAKRIVDLAGATAGLLVLAPVIPCIALAIRIDSPGPVIFSQTRVGRTWPTHTELFRMYKFRSMRVDAEANTGPVWAKRDDPRVTRVGRFLRKTRLDEIPQLVNILRGEMSIVGPRPERPGICGRLDETIPYYAERTVDVTPGITGLAQVINGYDESLDDVRRKLYFDHAYALSLSRPLPWLVMDAAILWRTIAVVFGARGR